MRVCFLRGEGLWKGNGLLVSRNVGRAGPTGSTVCVLYLTAVWPSPSAPSPPLHPILPSFTSAPLQSIPPSPADWWAVGLWHSSAEHTHSQRTSDPSLTQPWPRLECYRSFDTHSRKQTQGSLCPHSVLLNKKGEIKLLAEFQDFQQSKILEEWTCESLSNYCFLLLCKFDDSWHRFVRNKMVIVTIPLRCTIYSAPATIFLIIAI